jgi:hypothetical protein
VSIAPSASTLALALAEQVVDIDGLRLSHVFYVDREAVALFEALGHFAE